MKKDKLHLEMFENGQKIILKFASRFKDGLWRNYTREETWTIIRKGASELLLERQRGTFKLTNEDIELGMVRIVKTPSH